MITLSSGNKYYSEAEYNVWRDRYEKVKADFNIVSNALLEEAEERDWCSDYNEFVEKVNEHLTIMQLETLEKEYEVEVELTRTQSVTTYVTVTAANATLAEQIVESMRFDTIVEENVSDEDWNDDETDVRVNDAREA